MPLHVELVSPERQLYEGEAREVEARTVEGEIGFLSGHIPFVGTLLPWRVRVHQADGTLQDIAVHGGFLELSDDHLMLLCDIAELAQDIDVPRAQAALARADEALAVDEDNEVMQAAKARAEARLRTAGQLD